MSGIGVQVGISDEKSVPTIAGDNAFEAEKLNILKEAKEELLKSEYAGDREKARILQALIQALDAESFVEAMKKSLAQKCCCTAEGDLADAARYGCERCCALRLWQVGRDMQGRAAQTALHIAADKCAVGCVRLLAPFESDSLSGRVMPALSNAVFGKRAFCHLERIACVKVLTSYDAQLQGLRASNLIKACMLGDFARAERFESEIRSRDAAGRTALMYLAALGYDFMMYDIIPGSQRCKDEFSSTALMYAASHGQLSCVQRLVSLEAKLQRKDGRTALMLAAESGAVSCIEVLAEEEHGMQDEHGRTALMLALEAEQWACARLLIPFEAGKSDDSGQTALMVAARKGSVECVAALISDEAGKAQGEGWTAFFYAVKYQRCECAKLLLADENEAQHVPKEMIAAFTGNSRALMETKDRWESVALEGLTTMHFALVGRQERIQRLLTRSRDARAFFAAYEFDFAGMGGNSRLEIRALLSLLQDITERDRSKHFTDLVFKGGENEAKLLRPFCHWTPADDLREKLRSYGGADDTITRLKLTKCVGTIYQSGTFGDKGFPRGKTIKAFIESNPIFSKQLELLQKQFENNRLQAGSRRQRGFDARRQQHFTITDLRSEASFNRFILLSSRDVSWTSISSQKAIQNQAARQIRAKTSMLRLRTREGWRLLRRIVRAMLEE